MKKLLVLCLTLSLLLCCVALPASAAVKTSKDFVFSETALTLFEGESAGTTLLQQGELAGMSVTYYKSSNQNIASVSEDGTITGNSAGKATVSAYLEDGNTTYRANITVTVQRAVTSVTVNTTRWSVYDAEEASALEFAPADNELPVVVMLPNKSLSVSAEVLPKNASNRKISISSSDTSVVTTSASAFKAVASGECVVTVASQSNPEICEQFWVVVVTPVKKIEIEGSTNTLYQGGDSLELTAYYYPEDATVQDVTWTSSNTRVAEVSEDGVVTPLAKGTVNITAKATDGSNVSAAYKVTVDVRPTSVSLNQDDFTLSVKNSKYVRATVLPNNVTNKNVTWSTSDASVATVSKNGTVAAVAPGVATITAASNADPSVYASLTVTVVQPVTKVAFSAKSASVYVNSTVALYPEITPSNATIQDVTYKTSNANIATVDANGVVTGHKAGTVTITATATDGSRKAGTIRVQVIQPVEGVRMKSQSYRVGVNETLRLTAVISPSDATNKHMSWYVDDSTVCTIKGTTNTPTVTGKAWGVTTVYGQTEDGGYQCSAEVNVGNYNRALKVTDLYLQNNAIKIAVTNESNLIITRFNFTVDVYDMNGEELICCTNGTNSFTGYYPYTLYQYYTTTHGRFTFHNFIQPEERIGRLEMRITGYVYDDGEVYTIPVDRQEIVEYRDPDYHDPIDPGDPIVDPVYSEEEDNSADD